MKINPIPTAKGPINGENLTADTRNYPWHRPPEVTGFDAAVERMIKELDQDKEGELLYSLLELEVPVAIITTNLLMRKISKGILQIDLAVLIAGPVARYIEILALDNNITPDMDMSNGEVPVSAQGLLMKMRSDGAQPEEMLEEEAPEIPVEGEEEPLAGEGGLMAPMASDGPPVASTEEQAAMLGESPAEPTEELV